MILKDKIEELVHEKGFHTYAWLEGSKIQVAQWVRVKCMFGCSDYGLGACPPNTPSVEACRRFFNEYKTCILIQLKKFADKDHYPSDWSDQMTLKLLEIERELFFSGYHKAFLLNQTCCCLCKECPGSRDECLNKRDSRPSPEAFAVDVYQTVRYAGLEINVLCKSPSEMNRYAILMIE